MDNHDKAHLVAALEHATHTLALWIERTFRDDGLTHAEAHLLAYLAQHPQASINDLHTSFGHKRSTLTSILDRMEARGWTRRATHPSSRRLVAVELTDAGQAIGARVVAALAALEQRVREHAGAAATVDFLAVIHLLEKELQ